MRKYREGEGEEEEGREKEEEREGKGREERREGNDWDSILGQRARGQVLADGSIITDLIKKFPPLLWAHISRNVCCVL